MASRSCVFAAAAFCFFYMPFGLINDLRADSFYFIPAHSEVDACVESHHDVEVWIGSLCDIQGYSLEITYPSDLFLAEIMAGSLFPEGSYVLQDLSHPACFGGGAELSVSLRPQMVLLEPTDLCTLSIWVDHTDEAFDSYRSVLKWDSTILQYVTAIEGTVMTDPCGTNTWFIVNPGMDSLEIEQVRFPCDTMVTGPGSVSDVVFEALADGATDVVFDYLMFVRDGTALVARGTEIITHDARAIVGIAGIGPGPKEGSISPVVLPNPARTFLISCGEPDLYFSGQGKSSMYICDTRGRIVRQTLPRAAVGGYQYVWDGLDGQGRPVAPGVYFLRLIAPPLTQTSKLILVK